MRGHRIITHAPKHGMDKAWKDQKDPIMNVVRHIPIGRGITFKEIPLFDI